MSTTVSSFHRRVDAAAYLASIEVVGAAADALLAETGRSRHAWRVRVAEDALIDAALAAHDSECPAAHDECRCFHGDGDGRFDRRAADSVRRVAAAIGFADAAGIGGRGGVGGNSTVRIPSLRGEGMGKDRKHASDGRAWSAAIRDAAIHLATPQQAQHLLGEFAVTPDGRVVFGVFVGWDGAKIDAELALSAGLASNVDHAIPSAWLLTIAREGLRRAAGLAPWHEDRLPMAATPETLAAWAAAVNALAEANPN